MRLRPFRGERMTTSDFVSGTEKNPSLSIVIPTYGREQVLLDTVDYLLGQASVTPGFLELILIDQTARHEADTEVRLRTWAEAGDIRWLRASEPDLTRALNRGLCEGRGDIVLYFDDDIIPGEELLARHLAAHRAHPEAWAVVGQVLQPGEQAEDLPYAPRGGHLRRYLDFPFRRTQGAYVENAMAGNLSVVKERALALGGFDENFPPPVASRFETEFAKRLVAAGGSIWFEPTASIRHLQVSSGGTRSRGSHLTSALPIFGVGDYYFALRQGRGLEKWCYILRKPLREVRTKFHLRHPWWIPVKLVGEARAFWQAVKLNARGPRMLDTDDPCGAKAGRMSY
jgi:GT2 family glycosyltransferase